MSKLTGPLLTLAFTSCLPVMANAKTVSQTIFFDPGQVGETVEVSAFAEPGTSESFDFFVDIPWNVNGFDPSLGTLHSIALVGDLPFDGEVTTGVTGGGAGISNGFSLILDGYVLNGGGFGGGTGGGPNTTIPIPSFVTHPGGPPFTTEDDAETFDKFITTDPVALTIEMQYTLSPSGPGTSASMFMLEGGFLTLEYKYDIVPGDTNDDGYVSNSDLQVAIANFTGPQTFPATFTKTVSEGDTDGDGAVSNSDLQTAIANFTGPPPANATPEPTSLALLALGGLLIARRR